MVNRTKRNKDAQPAIHSGNLISKLSFAVTGRGIRESDIEKLMIDYRRNRGDDIVSRQAIIGWCSQHTKPKRYNALTFLDDFLAIRLDAEEASPDQKKVQTQIKAYLRRKLVRAVDKRDRAPVTKPKRATLNASRFTVDLKASSDTINEIADSWVGWYVSYRMRLLATPGTPNPIAREVVKIYLQDRSLRYMHWHKKDAGNTITFFEGGTLISKSSIWLLGFEGDDNRMRACHFKNFSSTNRNNTKVRWGLMHSDIPSAGYNEPASTRIVLVREDGQLGNVDSFIERNVRYLSPDLLRSSRREIIMRMIENDISAVSQDGSFRPRTQKDPILKVDQRTVEHLLTANHFISDTDESGQLS